MFTYGHGQTRKRKGRGDRRREKLKEPETTDSEMPYYPQSRKERMLAGMEGTESTIMITDKYDDDDDTDVDANRNDDITITKTTSPVSDFVNKPWRRKMCEKRKRNTSSNFDGEGSEQFDINEFEKILPEGCNPPTISQLRQYVQAGYLDRYELRDQTVSTLVVYIPNIKTRTYYNESFITDDFKRLRQQRVYQGFVIDEATNKDFKEMKDVVSETDLFNQELLDPCSYISFVVVKTSLSQCNQNNRMPAPPQQKKPRNQPKPQITLPIPSNTSPQTNNGNSADIYLTKLLSVMTNPAVQNTFDYALKESLSITPSLSSYSYQQHLPPPESQITTSTHSTTSRGEKNTNNNLNLYTIKIYEQVIIPTPVPKDTGRTGDFSDTHASVKHSTTSSSSSQSSSKESLAAQFRDKSERATYSVRKAVRGFTGIAICSLFFTIDPYEEEISKYMSTMRRQGTEKYLFGSFGGDRM